VTSTARKVTAGTAAILGFCGLLALGTWQLERRIWKLDLIARVEQRVHASPSAAPPLAEWPLVKSASHEYRHVRASGVFLTGLDTRVQALTELGAGFWVMTPLQLTDGGVVLVNRGFVPAEESPHTAPAPAQSAGPSTVTGLLRMSEPGGTLLRRNDPAADRWYSRDVQAIAATRRLGTVAPYFIDADRSVSARAGADAPIGGLTVIDFPNNHLIYAITWYTLALMIPVAIWLAFHPRQRTEPV